MKIDDKTLEKSLSKRDEDKIPKMSKETEIGFHNGALNTLVSERTELIKIIQNVEKIMGLHIERLKELGVNLMDKRE